MKLEQQHEIPTQAKDACVGHPPDGVLRRLAVGITALVLAVGPTAAQTVNVIYNFRGGDAGVPNYVIPAQGRDGRLYGTTYGILSAMGSIFRVSTSGQSHFLVAFDGTNGAKPIGGVTLGRDGNFYGVTSQGGSANLGVLFKITPGGAYTVLHEFAGGTDGGAPGNLPYKHPMVTSTVQPPKTQPYISTVHPEGTRLSTNSIKPMDKV